MNENTEKKVRGILTNKQLKKQLDDIAPKYPTTIFVRFLPYLDYCLKNQGYIQFEKITSEEESLVEYLNHKQILRLDGQRIEFVTKEFYDLIQNVLYESYVCII